MLFRSYKSKEGGIYRLSLIEKKYFLERTKYWDNIKEKERIAKLNSPEEQLKKYKSDKANLEYNLSHSLSELKTAKQKYPENIDFWEKKVKENKTTLDEFNHKN